MSDSQSNKSSFWITFAAAVGGFAIFVLILTVAYLPQKPGPIPEGTKTPEEREQILTELRAKEKAAATTYGWVDQQKGVVRIPIERAVELTIADANAKQ